MQDRPHGGRSQVHGEVFGVVPHERRHALIAGDAEAAERIGEPAHLIAEFAVGDGAVSPLAQGGGDRAMTVHLDRVAQDRGDGEWEVLHRAAHLDRPCRFARRWAPMLALVPMVMVMSATPVIGTKSQLEAMNMVESITT